MKDEKIITVALNAVPGFRAALFHRSLSCFGSPAGILKARGKELLSVPGVSRSLADAVAHLDVEGTWRRESAKAKERNVRIMTVFEKGYPFNLRQIHDPPPVLYLHGRIEPEDGNAIAIIGSRAATLYGKLTAEGLARDLAGQGITVVSGLARGIDSAAHRGALKSGGRTVAVLGSGMDHLYPPENSTLSEQIGGSGAVVTEFPFDARPEKRHFPMRNRLISGLSLGVVVVEAAARSGALITADLALEQGREVFAVPGNITSPRSAGPNRLIKEGARLVVNADDVIEELPQLAAGNAAGRGAPARACSLSDDEKAVLSHLSREPLSVEDVIRRSPAPSSRTLSILSALEIKGLVRQFAGRRYVRH